MFYISLPIHTGREEMGKKKGKKDKEKEKVKGKMKEIKGE